MRDWGEMMKITDKIAIDLNKTCLNLKIWKKHSLYKNLMDLSECLIRRNLLITNSNKDKCLKRNKMKQINCSKKLNKECKILDKELIK